MLVGRLDSHVHGGDIGFVVEGGGGSKTAVGIDTEQVVVLRTVAVGQGQGDRCVGVGVGYVESADDCSCNLVFQY